MPHSHIAVFVHFVWMTAARTPIITPDCERRLFRCIEANARKLDCHVLALNGTYDHVHLLVQLPAEVALAAAMHQIKGASARFMNAQRERDGVVYDTRWAWKACYGATSVSPAGLDAVRAYIANQKPHHAGNFDDGNVSVERGDESRR